MSQRPPFWHPSTLIATCFGLGYAPKAPGTVGAGVTAVVLLLFPASVAVGVDSPLYGISLTLATIYLAGVWSSRRYMSAVDTHDPGAIVIDEVIGMLVAWLFATLSSALVHAFWGPVSGLWIALSDSGRGEEFLHPAWVTSSTAIAVGAFLLFRLFDIWKPGPVGRIDREFDGPHGVMLDDVAAGVMAGLAWFAFTVAALIVWLALAWAKPETGWQQSGSPHDSALQTSALMDRELGRTRDLAARPSIRLCAPTGQLFLMT